MPQGILSRHFRYVQLGTQIFSHLPASIGKPWQSHGWSPVCVFCGGPQDATVGVRQLLEGAAADSRVGASSTACDRWYATSAFCAEPSVCV